jgi:hypothetical protein
MPAGAAAAYRERPDRLKPGLLRGEIWIKHAPFIRWHYVKSCCLVKIVRI